MKPVIGRDYWPNKTLRQMPRHWVLEDAHRPEAFPLRAWVLAMLIIIFFTVLP